MLRELQVPLSPELTYAHERQMNNVGVHGAVIIGAIFHSQRHLIRLESVGFGPSSAPEQRSVLDDRHSCLNTQRP